MTGDLLIPCLSLGWKGCSDNMGSCCSCLDRDSVPHNHPTKFKVPRASPCSSSQGLLSLGLQYLSGRRNDRLRCGLSKVPCACSLMSEVAWQGNLTLFFYFWLFFSSHPLPTKNNMF